MKVVAYNIQEFEKETLAKANAKIHAFTMISNSLNINTVHYTKGKEVVVISDRDVLTPEILDALVSLGVKKIITRSVKLDHIDLTYAGKLQLHVANTPEEDGSFESIAKQTISNLNNWSRGACLGIACHCSYNCEKKKY